MKEERHVYTNGEKVSFKVNNEYSVLVIRDSYNYDVDEVGLPSRAVLDLFDFLSANIEKFRKNVNGEGR
jgi:hypothetical protein